MRRAGMQVPDAVPPTAPATAPAPVSQPPPPARPDRFAEALKAADRGDEVAAAALLEELLTDDPEHVPARAYADQWDIDGLAAINGSHGHVAADDAIAQLGRLVAERFRASDLRCRWAGGQFALLFDGAGKQDIAAALKRLLADFGGCRFQAQGALAFRATLSGGVAAFPEDGESLHALLTGADQRLARAKRAGGGQLWSSDAAPLGKESA